MLRRGDDPLRKSESLCSLRATPSQFHTHSLTLPSNMYSTTPYIDYGIGVQNSDNLMKYMVSIKDSAECLIEEIAKIHYMIDNKTAELGSKDIKGMTGDEFMIKKLLEENKKLRDVNLSLERHCSKLKGVNRKLLNKRMAKKKLTPPPAKKRRLISDSDDDSDGEEEEDENPFDYV